jgi:tRNA G18 (ribose-2'-O)-methylase SpoU
MRITYRERHRRIREADEEAWAPFLEFEGDPGLREEYESFPRAPIRLICCPLNKDPNQGGMLRLAEAYRLERVDFSAEPDGGIDMSGHRGTRRWQPHGWQPVEDSVRQAKEAGYMTVALTFNPRAVALEDVSFRFPLALVLGAEKEGVPPEIEAQCDVAAAIPLYGLVASLNVTTAAAIALNDVIREYARQHPHFEPVRNASRRLLGLPPASYG